MSAPIPPPSRVQQPLHDRQSRVHRIRGSPDWSLQCHASPSTPLAATCLWESSLLASSGNWFNNARSAGVELGLGFVLISRSKQIARFRVTHQHQQPSGLLHGGVSALIAEEMGSIASALNVAPLPVVGISVQATHLASAKIGDVVVAVCTPIKGKGKLQVWKIELFKDEEVENALASVKPDSGSAADGTVDAAALFYKDWMPKGIMLATCQLTATARPPNENSKTSFPAAGVTGAPRSKL